ncbi:hypothetical protein JD844_003912 [Phrynosoma platyrhinos]|uniref:Uncharacterized protein n=1 Tax=Phrynosoma platyrhinos TaxID=52577 RepID=A0ABQ7TM07_PHRPL|nr:hypothetical protein JD844_003912 [Phrynosoma platyrhinos]
MEFWKGYAYSVKDPGQGSGHSDAMYVVVPLLGMALLIVIGLFIIWRCQLQKATRHRPSYAQSRYLAGRTGRGLPRVMVYREASHHGQSDAHERQRDPAAGTGSSRGEPGESRWGPGPTSHSDRGTRAPWASGHLTNLRPPGPLCQQGLSGSKHGLLSPWPCSHGLNAMWGVCVFPEPLTLLPRPECHVGQVTFKLSRNSSASLPPTQHLGLLSAPMRKFKLPADWLAEIRAWLPGADKASGVTCFAGKEKKEKEQSTVSWDWQLPGAFFAAGEQQRDLWHQWDKNAFGGLALCFRGPRSP